MTITTKFHKATRFTPAEGEFIAKQKGIDWTYDDATGAIIKYDENDKILGFIKYG